MPEDLMVRVNFYGILREVAGKESEEVSLESGSLEELLRILSTRFGGRFKSFFFKKEILDSQINIFVNHAIVPSQKIPEIKLCHEDLIDLFVPVSGG
jgi:molybdopterin converting factor small subunit